MTAESMILTETDRLTIALALAEQKIEQLERLRRDAMKQVCYHKLQHTLREPENRDFNPWRDQ